MNTTLTNQAPSFLKQGLTQYGLNPLEWTLIQISEKLFQIVHCQDEHFQFLGRCNTQGEWVAVTLLSL